MKSFMRLLGVILLVFLCAQQAHAQATNAIAPSPAVKQQFFDDSGAPLAGGLLFTYQCGTTTPQPTYTDASGLYQSTNPIVLDSAGRAVIFVGQSCYKYILQNSLGVQLWSVDGVQTFPTGYAALTVTNLTTTTIGTASLTASSQITAPNIIDTLLTGGLCVTAAVGGQLQSATTPCFVPTGTICYVTACPLVAPSFTGATLTNTTMLASNNLHNSIVIGAGPTIFGFNGELREYQGQIIAGLPVEVSNVQFRSIAPFTNPCPNGLNGAGFNVPSTGPGTYELKYNFSTASAGSAGTYALTISWTDPAAQPHSITTSTINLATTGNLISGSQQIWAGAGTTISSTFASSGVSGSPTCTGSTILVAY
jgi:hypothetical protein